MEVLTPERTLTELDHVRITNLVHRHKRDGTRAAPTLPIEQLLDDADIVPWRQVAPDIVTMHSQVLVKDLQTGARQSLTLSYPANADASAGSVSVMSPIGLGLIGQKVGAIVRWPTPAGDERSAEILAILFQPESSGQHAM